MYGSNKVLSVQDGSGALYHLGHGHVVQVGAGHPGVAARGRSVALRLAAVVDDQAGRADGVGDVGRARVVGDQQVEAADDGGQGGKRRAAGKIAAGSRIGAGGVDLFGRRGGQIDVVPTSQETTGAVVSAPTVSIATSLPLI